MKEKKLQSSVSPPPKRPFYPVLPEEFIDPKLLTQLRHSRCVAWQCLPICEDAAGITVATSQELGIPEIEPHLQQIFAKKIIWVLCSEAYLSAAIQRTFGFFTR